MCGRFTLRQWNELNTRFQAHWELEDSGAQPPRFNIAPSQSVPIVLAEGNQRHLQLARWGLIPGWAKDAAIGNKMINARAETLDEKPSFRAALRARRCLVPADGFFEWYTPTAAPADARGKPVRQPLFFHRPDDGLFAFAGLYEHWRDPAGQMITSCTVISTRANGLMAPYHDRVPVILRPDQEADWLAPDAYSSGRWRHLLEPWADDLLTVYPITTLVNNPRHDSPAVLERTG